MLSHCLRHCILAFSLGIGLGACVGSAHGAPAPGEEPTPRAFTVNAGRLELPALVEFAAGSADLLPASEDALRFVQAYLQQKSEVSLLRIEVHGVAAKLTGQRALAVGRRLVELGVDPARLLPVGFGMSKPIADPSTPDGRAHNQRVEFRPAALRGHPIGGMPVDGGGEVAGALGR